jgi:hypothetical protein
MPGLKVQRGSNNRGAARLVGKFNMTGTVEALHAWSEGTTGL